MTAILSREDELIPLSLMDLVIFVGFDANNGD